MEIKFNQEIQDFLAHMKHCSNDELRRMFATLMLSLVLKGILTNQEFKIIVNPPIPPKED